MRPARQVRRAVVCPHELLRTPEEVDAYARQLACALKAELEKARASGEDGIVLG